MASHTRQYRILFAVLSVCSPFCWGQAGTLKSGNVPVPGATVTATQGERVLRTLSDANGGFQFSGLTAGAWTIEADMFGFQHLRREVQIADTPTRIELSLALQER